MGPTTGTGKRYDTAISELWSGLARTLSQLDAAAAKPESLDRDDSVTALRRLQYRLHRAREDAFGLRPPVGTETAHAELSAALKDARDATAEVAEVASIWGAEGAEPLLYEWRGALFRVRLARLRLSQLNLAPPGSAPAGQPEDARAGIGRALASFLLALVGAVGFVAGVTLTLRPVWVASLAAVFGAILVYRDA
ncbi:MAG: hypothetical protein ACRDLK_11190 [Gaiellaceae bacterium]